MAPKPYSWKRKEGAAAAEEKAHEVEEEVAVEEMQDQNQATDNSKWENHQENSQEKQTSWGPKGANEEGDGEQKDEGKSHNTAGSSHNTARIRSLPLKNVDYPTTGLRSVVDLHVKFVVSAIIPPMSVRNVYLGTLDLNCVLSK